MVRPGRPTSGDATRNGILIGVAGGDPVYLTIDDLGPLTIEEVDGSPTVGATKLVLPNGTLGVVGTVATYTPAGVSLTGSVFPIVFGFDGGGSAITGAPEVDLGPMHCGGTISEWTILEDVSGAASIEVWKDTYANYPPTSGDLLLTLTLSGPAIKAQATGLSHAFSAGDTFRFHLASSSTVTRLAVMLHYTRA